MSFTAPKCLASAAAVLALAIPVSFGTAKPAQAEAAATTAGCGVSLTPKSRNVRRGGTVLVQGELCGAGTSSAGQHSVQLKIQKGKRWATVGNAQTDSSGEFAVCARVSVPNATKVARLRATSDAGTGVATLRVGKKGPSGCGGGGNTDKPSKPSGYKPPPIEQGNPNCPLSQPNSDIGMTLPSECTVVASDTASNPDPIAFWGRLDCASADRHQVISSGGDTHSTADGSSQGNGSFRRMTAYDGDDVWGERCELGDNWNTGKNTFYHEGIRRVTYASIRLPASSDVNNPNWRNVLQMKQAQPYTNPNPASIFEVQARGGYWNVGSNWEDLWEAPAAQNTWTRFAFDIVYSSNASVGSIKVYVDLNNDGDASDANEQSPRIFKDTLRVEEGAGIAEGSAPGQTIPSTLRAGIYQNSNYSCPSGCSVDIDNVQVVKP
jgi:hypothetical protein